VLGDYRVGRSDIDLLPRKAAVRSRRARPGFAGVARPDRGRLCRSTLAAIVPQNAARHRAHQSAGAAEPAYRR